MNSEESSTVFFFLTGEAAKAVKQDCDDRKRFVVRVDEKFIELESAIRRRAQLVTKPLLATQSPSHGSQAD